MSNYYLIKKMNYPILLYNLLKRSGIDYVYQIPKVIEFRDLNKTMLISLLERHAYYGNSNKSIENINISVGLYNYLKKCHIQKVADIKKVDYNDLNQPMLVELLEQFGQFTITLIKGRKRS